MDSNPNEAQEPTSFIDWEEMNLALSEVGPQQLERKSSLERFQQRRVGHKHVFGYGHGHGYVRKYGNGRRRSGANGTAAELRRNNRRKRRKIYQLGRKIKKIKQLQKLLRSMIAANNEQP